MDPPLSGHWLVLLNSRPLKYIDVFIIYRGMRCRPFNYIEL